MCKEILNMNCGEGLFGRRKPSEPKQETTEVLGMEGNFGEE